MQRETFPVGPLQCNCSILYDLESHDATVVDPGGDVSKILLFLGTHALKLRQILITHAHLDHIAGAKALADATQAPILLNQNDLPLLALMDDQARFIGVRTPELAPTEDAADGLRLIVGGETGEVLHTPGHTPGSTSIYFPQSNLLIAGDTLFRGGIGRTDLWLGDGRQILNSIRNRLLHLPEDTTVIAGHGASTTIGLEKDRNPFLAR